MPTGGDPRRRGGQAGEAWTGSGGPFVFLKCLLDSLDVTTTWKLFHLTTSRGIWAGPPCLPLTRPLHTNPQPLF